MNIKKFNKENRTNFEEKDLKRNEKGLYLIAYQLDDSVDTKCVEKPFDIAKRYIKACSLLQRRIENFLNKKDCYYDVKENKYNYFWINRVKIYIDEELGIIEDIEEITTILEKEIKI